MNWFRVSHYAPDHSEDAWMHISCVGVPSKSGVTLSMEEYLRREQLYVDLAAKLMACSGENTLQVNKANPLTNKGDEVDGSQASVEEVGQLVRANLREDSVIRLGSATTHISWGYDMYMYIGVPDECVDVVNSAGRSGLRVEPGLIPPYMWVDDDDDDDDDEDDE